MTAAAAASAASIIQILICCGMQIHIIDRASILVDVFIQ